MLHPLFYCTCGVSGGVFVGTAAPVAGFMTVEGATGEVGVTGLAVARFTAVEAGAVGIGTAAAGVTDDGVTGAALAGVFAAGAWFSVVFKPR